MPGVRERNRAGVIAAAWVASALLAGAAGWWAAHAALAPPADPLPEPAPPTYEVAEGMLERTMTFTATAEWDLEPLARNAATGVVTSVAHEPGTPAGPGDELYRVDLRPVVAGHGDVPAFRDLASGAHGEDVAQLQRLLGELDLYDGPVDGDFGAGTAAAVRRWQRHLGLTDDGQVRAGDIVWLPDPDAALTLGEAIAVGATLSGGEDAVLGLADEPEVHILLSADQRDLVPPTADVRLTHPDGTWEGRIASTVEREATAELILTLEGPDGGPICGQDCGRWIPPGEESVFRSDLIVVPETRGPVVPVAALRAEPDGDASLTSASGARLPVEIRARVDGLAVVEGVEPGTTVLLHGEEASAGGAPNDASSDEPPGFVEGGGSGGEEPGG